MSNRKVVFTNGNDEEVKTVEIKNNEVDITLDDSAGWVLANLGDDETKSLEWRLVMAEHHNKRLSHENAALREALRLKEAECESFALDKQSLMIDLSLCIEELKAWASEYDDSDSNLLIEKMEESLTELGGGDEQQAD